MSLPRFHKYPQLETLIDTTHDAMVPRQNCRLLWQKLDDPSTIEAVFEAQLKTLLLHRHALELLPTEAKG